MKKEAIEKIVANALYAITPGVTRNIDKVSVPFEVASANGLAAQISNVIRYQDCRFSGFREDIVIYFTDYDNAINISFTQHDADDKKVLGYVYKSCIYLTGKTQVEVACELCAALAMYKNGIRYI